MKWICTSLILFAGLSGSIAKANESLCFVWKGVNGDLLKNIQARLQLEKSSCLFHLSFAKVKLTYLTSQSIIRDGLKPYGYFKSSLYSTLTYTNKGWIATYHIYPGPALKITSISVSVIGPGKDNIEIQKHIRQISIKPGDTFDVPAYNIFKDKLFVTAKNQGYIKAFFNNQILINLKRYTCHIAIQLNTGNRYYFDSIKFDNDGYANSFLKRFINFSPGEPFSSKKLMTLQQAMEHSYYFQQVIITPDLNNIENYHIPTHFYFILPKAKQYSLGLGYGTLTGPRLSAAMHLRRITNTGHHFETQLKLSSVLSALTANYYIPGYNPLTETYVFGANAKRFAPNAGRSDSATLSAAYLLKQDKTQESISLNYLIERFRINPLPFRKAHLLYPDFKFTFFSTDDLIRPHQGLSFTFNLQGAAQQILSTTSFLQSLIKAKFVFSPFSFSRFIMRGDFGYTTVHNLYKFPLSQRFFAGGVNSIRGFADSSIGPGRYLEVASLEYQNKIVNNLYAALFYDAGTAANHFKTRLNRGAGVGIVYDAVIGPVKIYLARAISKKTKPYSLEFSVGPEFA